MRGNKKKARDLLVALEITSWLAGIISTVLELIKFSRGD